MKPSTVAALNRINLRFYSRHGETFAATRRQPWPGWRRVLSAFAGRRPTRGRGTRVEHILDVGCGDGRFGDFLAHQLRDADYRYVGIDSSAVLLRVAARRLCAPHRGLVRLRQLDLVSQDPRAMLRGSSWDLIVLFGLLHHLPSNACRRSLLELLVSHLAPWGLLAMTFWQFGELERFRNRVIPWTEHNRVSDEKIDLDELEPGDVLLAWGEGSSVSRDDRLGPRRYCHFMDPQSAETLVSQLGLEQLEVFRSDGERDTLNLYYVLRRGIG